MRPWISVMGAALAKILLRFMEGIYHVWPRSCRQQGKRRCCGLIWRCRRQRCWTLCLMTVSGARGDMRRRCLTNRGRRPCKATLVGLSRHELLAQPFGDVRLLAMDRSLQLCKQTAITVPLVCCKRRGATTGTYRCGRLRRGGSPLRRQQRGMAPYRRLYSDKIFPSAYLVRRCWGHGWMSLAVLKTNCRHRRRKITAPF